MRKVNFASIINIQCLTWTYCVYADAVLHHPCPYRVLHVQWLWLSTLGTEPAGRLHAGNAGPLHQLLHPLIHHAQEKNLFIHETISTKWPPEWQTQGCSHQWSRHSHWQQWEKVEVIWRGAVQGHSRSIHLKHDVLL